MTRGFAFMLALLAVPCSAGAQSGNQPAGEHPGRAALRGINANPTALIAAEIALGKLAGEKGESFALLATAAPGARLMRPEPVDAAQWLKRNQQRGPATRWDGQAVWMSCDGTIGVVKGKWSNEGQAGRFATVWQRQAKGDYKWLLRLDEPGTSNAPSLDDMLSAVVADCPARPARAHAPEEPRGKPRGKRAPVPIPQVDALSGRSPDGSLHWRSGSDTSGVTRLLVQLAKGGAMTTVLGAELEEAPKG